MRRLPDDEFELDSGRRIYANNWLLSVASANSFLSHGYDGTLTEELTKEERQEIARYMIALWNDWAAFDGGHGP